jgi:hypothetical protein
MGERRNRKLLTASAGLLEQGEAVQLITAAKLGSAPVAANATAAVVSGVVVSLLGGGVGFVAFRQREVYLVLTDRQLLFFEADRSTGNPGKHLASLRREHILCTEPAGKLGGLFVKFQLVVPGLSEPIRLTFPPLPPRLRKEGRLLATALPRVRS